jgi:hypothetical protein
VSVHGVAAMVVPCPFLLCSRQMNLCRGSSTVSRWHGRQRLAQVHASGIMGVLLAAAKRRHINNDMVAWLAALASSCNSQGRT